MIDWTMDNIKTLRFVETSITNLLERFGSSGKFYYIRIAGKGDAVNVGNPHEPIKIYKYLEDNYGYAYRYNSYWYLYSVADDCYYKIEDSDISYIYDTDGAGEIWIPYNYANN